MTTSRADVIKDYQQVAQQLDKRPTLDEYNEHGEHSSTLVYKFFDSIQELKAEAGFEKGEHTIPTQDLKDDLQRVADEIGRAPPVEVYREHGEYNFKTVKRRFGSWHDVLNEAGFEPTDHSENWSDTTYSEYERPKVVVPCDYCGEPTKKREHQLKWVENVYCDEDCKYAHHAAQTGEDAPAWEGGKVAISCEVCDDTKRVRPAKVDKSRFCSQDCMIEWRTKQFSGEDHPRWKGGYERYYGPNWRQQRRKARQRDEYECQQCGLSREEHNEKWGCDPVVHHIERFGDFDDYEEANRLKNLVTLCKQCHGLVESGRVELPESVAKRI
jgi:5-methylcytosine-specific restriction endonuclease McrA